MASDFMARSSTPDVRVKPLNFKQAVNRGGGVNEWVQDIKVTSPGEKKCSQSESAGGQQTDRPTVTRNGL